MPNEPRSYDTYQQLKENESFEITKENAEIIFSDLKKNLLNQLKQLNVNSITEVEDFYLLVSKFNRCLSLICAKNESENKGISFDESFMTIGNDDIREGLIANFEKEIEQSYLHKINEIDEKYKPAKQSWAALHVKFLSLYESLKSSNNFKLTYLIEKNIYFLEIEENKFRNCGALDLAEKAKELIDNIELSAKNYLVKQNESLFIEEIKSSIANASSITEEQGWRGVIDNIARTIIDFFSKESVSNFSFFTNPIKENIEEFQTDLNSMYDKK